MTGRRLLWRDWLSVIVLTVVGLELDPEEKEKESLFTNKEYKHPKGEISFPAVTGVTCRP